MKKGILITISLAFVVFVYFALHSYLSNTFYGDYLYANLGNPQAQYALGVMYSDEHNERYNPQEAVKWYTKALENGYLDAATMLGKMYE